MQPLTSQDLPTMATAERNRQTIFWRPPSAAKLFFHQPTPQHPRSLTALTDSHQFAAANDASGDDLHTSRSYLFREDRGGLRPEHRGFSNILIYIKSSRLTGDRWAERRWKQGNWEGGKEVETLPGLRTTLLDSAQLLWTFQKIPAARHCVI